MVKKMDISSRPCESVHAKSWHEPALEADGAACIAITLSVHKARTSASSGYFGMRGAKI